MKHENTSYFQGQQAVNEASDWLPVRPPVWPSVTDKTEKKIKDPALWSQAEDENTETDRGSGATNIIDVFAWGRCSEFSQKEKKPFGDVDCNAWAGFWLHECGLMPHICPSDLLCVLFSTQALSVNDERSERRAVASKVHSYVCLRPDVSVSCRMIKLIRPHVLHCPTPCMSLIISLWVCLCPQKQN